MLRTDRDLWAAAETVVATYGDNPMDYLSKRMLHASSDANDDDLSMWQGIARCIALLTAASAAADPAARDHR